MSIQPIPTTARLPVEYIPTPMDVERYERETAKKIEGLDRLLHTAIEQRRIEENSGNEGKPDHLRRSLPPTKEMILLEKSVSDERLFAERNAATMRQVYPTPVRFLLQVPTSVEREQINGRLISLGLNQVTIEQIRATMIEELFHQDWGKGDAAANEAEAEDIANFLDGCWQRQEVHDSATAAWQEQERERVLDEAAGAPPRPRADLPPKIITVREQARLSRTIEHMMAISQPLRDIAARATDFARQNAMILVRMHVLKVDGIDIDVSLERDPITRALSNAAVEAIREKLDDACWHDLVSYIDRMYKLDGYEEKNSVSPLEKPSDPNGSTGPSGGLEASDGSSTISSITPAPADASGTIIANSSASTSDSALAEAMGPISFPTAEASSTSL